MARLNNYVSPGLNAGQLDREIILQTARAVQSDSGEETFDWANAVSETIWAQWVGGGATEVWKAAQRLQAMVDGLFRVYDIDPRPSPHNTRILFDGKIYDLQGVMEIGRGEGLELIVVAHGETP